MHQSERRGESVGHTHLEEARQLERASEVATGVFGVNCIDVGRTKEGREEGCAATSVRTDSERDSAPNTDATPLSKR